MTTSTKFGMKLTEDKMNESEEIKSPQRIPLDSCDHPGLFVLWASYAST